MQCSSRPSSNSADPEYQIEATFWHFFIIALSLEVQHWPGICRSHQRMSNTLVKTTQNDLIHCICSHIRDNILKIIKEYSYYSILCNQLVDIPTMNRYQ